MQLEGSRQQPVLLGADAPEPSPGTGELLIRVSAVGVTRTELSWDPTWQTKTGEPRVGGVPGHEFAGVVAATGDGVGDMEAGHEVFGMNDWYANGAMAEFCVTRFSSVARKPPILTFVEAASVPIGALTAWQGLFDRAKLRPGETVLVHGGAGSVGIFAIQLAKLQGARVITTVSAHNMEYVLDLGADVVIDYRTTPFETRVKNVDVVFDTVGGETLERSWDVLKPDGRMVTIVSAGQDGTNDRVKRAFFIVKPNQKQLVEVGDLIARGQLQTAVDAVVPLDHASDAYFGKVERLGRGKVVVAVGLLN